MIPDQNLVAKLHAPPLQSKCPQIKFGMLGTVVPWSTHETSKITRQFSPGKRERKKMVQFVTDRVICMAAFVRKMFKSCD